MYNRINICMPFNGYDSLLEALDADQKKYIDKKFADIEATLISTKEKSKKKEAAEESDKTSYVVVPGQSAGEWGETLIITDVTRGIVVGRISARGRLISHPIVAGNSCSFAVQQRDGTALGTTHDLPSGALNTTFRVGGAGAEDVTFDPIFKRKQDFIDAASEPGGDIAKAIAEIADDIAQDVIKTAIPPTPAEQQTPPAEQHPELDVVPAHPGEGEEASIVGRRTPGAVTPLPAIFRQPIPVAPATSPEVKRIFQPEPGTSEVRRQYGLQA